MAMAASLIPLLLLGLLSRPAAAQNDGSQETLLDKFVFSEESLSEYSYFHAEEFDFEAVNPVTGLPYKAFILNMTSGDWRTEEEVGIRATWWHVLALIIPDNLKPEYATNATIFVDGHTNEANGNTGMPDPDDDALRQSSALATGIGVPFAVLYQVPNAPIVFSNDPTQESRTEDEIVAYTFEEYLENPDDPEKVVYLGMVRAAVRAMDTISDFTGEQFGTNVTHYTITGRSKRGWTSWLTGAMDQERVVGIMPIVWDGINVDDVFHHQYRSYGGWANAIVDYIENKVVTHLDTPEMVLLQDLIDPFHYRTRYTMPKMLLTGLMDEFQHPDDEQYWWNDLPSGPVDGSSAPSDGNTKWLVKNPNAEHSMVTALGVQIPMMGQFVSYLLNGWELPYLTWEYDEDTGDVTAMPHGGQVYSAQMWFATSCNTTRRDFRISSLDDPCFCGPVFEDDDEAYCLQAGAFWAEEKLEPNEDGSYTGHLDAPEDGRWSAFVVNIQMTTEHTYREDPLHNMFTRGAGVASSDPQPRFPFTPQGVLEFSSRASVVPNTFPFEDCTGEGCDGGLV